LFAPELDLQLMTTVAGNVSVEKTTRNGLQLLHFWDADVPLAHVKRDGAKALKLLVLWRSDEDAQQRLDMVKEFNELCHSNGLLS
ncbi:hypothetical protein ONN26_24700, partial [Salmonella enterica subsp. enterica serovar Muenster]|nr:hypothetical protein [Salmonella enterica subsp. enterica serovar Muenster]